MDNKVYVDLGKLVENFNKLEMIVIFIIGGELKLDRGNDFRKLDLVVKDLTYQNKINLLRNLIVERDQRDNFKDLYKKLKKCGEKRNELLHSQWFVNYGSDPTNISTHRINRNKLIKLGKPTDYKKMSIQVEDEIDTLNKLIDQTIKEMVMHLFK